MKLGLKCYPEDLDLAKNFSDLFDFIEVLILPNFDINELVKYDFKINIHAAHENYGFCPEKNDAISNEIIAKAYDAADLVNSEYVVAHPGPRLAIDSKERMINFFKNNFDKRLVIENIISPHTDGLPYLCCFSEEMKEVKESIGCDFLFDVGHAIVSSNRSGFNTYKTINDFLELSPKVHHVYGVNINSFETEQHMHFHNVKTDYSYYKNFNKDSIFTFETEWLSKSKREDYLKNIAFLKEALNSENESEFLVE